MAGASSTTDKSGTAITAGKGGSQFVRSLAEGLVAGGIVFVLLLAWMFLRASDTAEKFQHLIPVKTAIIEVPDIVTPPLDPNAPKEALNDSKNINALPAAPLPGLTENLNGRQLPITRIEDDMTPFQAYKRAFSMVAGRALVSLVIVDYGLSEKTAQSLLDTMPPDVTFVLTPYAASPAQWAMAARTYGHEFWLTLPMQGDTITTNDSGPETLLLNVTDKENEERLFGVLGKAVGYAGLVSGQNHAFTMEGADPGEVMKQVFGRGLAFAESNPGIPAYGLKMAMEFGYPYAQNTVWLDVNLRPDALDQALKDLELQATQKGKVIAFFHPYPLVVNKVQDWIKDADQKGVQIAPLSAMVQ